MRPSLLLAISLIACVSVSSSAQTNAVPTITRLDSLWARVYATHDTVGARQLYAADLVFTSANGSQKDLEKELDDIRPQPGLTMHYFRTTPREVRVHDGTAVATGVAEWRFTWNGQQRELKRSYTSVYVRGGPLGWRIVAVHMGMAQ